MNKYLVLLISVLVISFNSLSQDLIITHTGEEQLVKIVEINLEDIKYKKFSNSDGPTYSMLKSSIFMIKYENGEKENFKDFKKSDSSNEIKPVNSP